MYTLFEYSEENLITYAYFHVKQIYYYMNDDNFLLD
jgi:hypothetical protein